MSAYAGPGKGWRLMSAGEDTPDDLSNLIVWYDELGAELRWVPEEPVPPLPTEPYAVIRVTWRDSGKQEVMTAYEDGTWWGGLTGDEVRKRITGFEVLAVPVPGGDGKGWSISRAIASAEGRVRRETAKAVLDRVMITGISGAVGDQLYREFGVEP